VRTWPSPAAIVVAKSAISPRARRIAASQVVYEKRGRCAPARASQPTLVVAPGVARGARARLISRVMMARPIRWPRSLEQKLPLLMTAVLAVVLASSLFLTYGALTRSAEGAARDRLTRAVRQVAVSVSEGTRQRASLVAAAAATPEMRAALGPASDTNSAR